MDGQAIEMRLLRVEARQAIEAVVNRLRRSSDQGNDPAISRDLLAPGARWRVRGADGLLDGELLVEGRDNILAAASQIARDTILQSLHFTGPVEIDLDDDGLHAACRWYLWELLQARRPQGVQVEILGGWYDAQMGMHSGRWLIEDIVLNIRIQGPAAPGWIFS
nr:nuclear transport factor 2 family protein [Sphingomonas sp. Y57]